MSMAIGTIVLIVIGIFFAALGMSLPIPRFWMGE